MAAPLPNLDTRSLDELKRLVARLLARVAALEEENRQLREENARLKGLPKRPKLAPGGMEQTSGPAEARRRGRKRRGGRRTPPITEERTLRVSVPPGSRRKGYEPYTVQDLLLSPLVIRYRRERWVTPDGQAIIAPLPAEVRGHFGPGIVRFVLMQHVQGQVTTERLLVQLRALGVRIAKGQLLALLSTGKDDFHGEKDAILEAGLASARWVTVDDTGARHAGRNETTTHIGDERFAWFATRPSKSRLNFLELLRAGHGDYVVDAEALAYMREHGLAGSVIALLAGHPQRVFPDQAAWRAHLERLGITALTVTPDPVRLATEGALWGAIKAHGLLPETVIVSDDAGQFALGEHALCWIHAERLVHKLETFTDQQRAAQARIRDLIWWFYTDLKAYRQEPSRRRRAELRARFDRIFRRRTGFVMLDRLLERLHANKAELLRVLDRPEIPLHTNGSENDIRAQVTRRKVSGGTRSDLGRDCRDAFLGLAKTCAKLGLSFWDYLGARLGITGQAAVPYLPDLVRERCRPA